MQVEAWFAPLLMLCGFWHGSRGQALIWVKVGGCLTRHNHTAHSGPAPEPRGWCEAPAPWGWVNPVLETIHWIVSGGNARSAGHGRCQIGNLANCVFEHIKNCQRKRQSEHITSNFLNPHDLTNSSTSPSSFRHLGHKIIFSIAWLGSCLLSTYLP